MNALAEVSHVEIEKIDSLTAQTRTLIQNLKGRIKRLESASLQQDAQLRKNRVTSPFSQTRPCVTPFILDISSKVEIS